MENDYPNLLILTSPPASGKTFLIAKLNEEFKSKSLLVISPLRALADECKLSWRGEIKIQTPEEWLKKKETFDYVIFDEFHLFFYWGDSFRPLMWEVFYEVSYSAKMVILLTATMSEEIKKEIEFFSNHFSSIYWTNFGNQILKYEPKVYIKASSKKWILNQIELKIPNKHVHLVFCQYRQEVLALEKYLSQKGFSCISCIGGESRQMREKLITTPTPDFIISTTVLSHGVNLPKIRKIYFLYEVKNIDFWIQMVARGGRRGEDYEVLALEKPHGIKWSILTNFIKVVQLTLKHKISHFFSTFQDFTEK
jgi:ATP-dependent DNA helicase RecQ